MLVPTGTVCQRSWAALAENRHCTGATRYGCALRTPKPFAVVRPGPLRPKVLVASVSKKNAGSSNGSNDVELERLDAEITEVVEELNQAKKASSADPGDPQLRQVVADLKKKMVDLLDERVKTKLSGPAGMARTAYPVTGILKEFTLPATNYPEELDHSGTSSVNARQPRGVQRWCGFHEDASEWVSRKAMEASQSDVPYQPIPLNPCEDFEILDEGGVYSYMDMNVGKPVVALFAIGLLGDPVKLVKSTNKHLRMPDEDPKLKKLGFPDRAISTLSDKPKELVLVEVKQKYALSSSYPSLLEYRRVTKDKTPEYKHVEQLYGYLWHRNVKYAVLCSDEEFWFCWVDRQQEVLYIADPIRFDQREPTVIGAFCFITHLAQQDLPTLGPSQGSLGGGPRPIGKPRSVRVSAAVLLQQMLGMAGSWLAAAQIQLRKWIFQRPASQASIVRVHDLHLIGLLNSGITGSAYAGCYGGVPVAVKVPSRQGGRKQGADECKRQLQNEVEVYSALAPLQGNEIPRVMAFGTMVTDAYDSVPFIAMERIMDGEPLSEAGADGSKLSRWAAEAAADSAYAALKTIHARGVAHNDISGNNVLATPDGRAFIIDFGHSVVGASQAEMEEDFAALSWVTSEMRRNFVGRTEGQARTAGQALATPLQLGN